MGNRGIITLDTTVHNNYHIFRYDGNLEDYCCQVSGGTPTHVVNVPIIDEEWYYTDEDDRLPYMDHIWDNYDGEEPVVSILVSETVAEFLESHGVAVAYCDMWPPGMVVYNAN